MSQDGCARSLPPLPVVLPQRHELGSSFDAVHCLFSDTFEEKFDPGLPGRLLTDSQKHIGIFRTMLLEINAQVEQRFRKNVALAKQQRNQEPTDSTSAIATRVAGFKLIILKRPIK